PKRPPLPKLKDASWARSPIDRFILARLKTEGLQPTAEADRVHLIRRVTFDLTGLPPTPAEVDAFLADKSPDAYEKVVDRYCNHSVTASTWLATGSMPPATVTRTGCTSTTTVRSGRIATGSSGRSTTTCLTISS